MLTFAAVIKIKQHYERDNYQANQAGRIFQASTDWLRASVGARLLLQGGQNLWSVQMGWHEPRSIFQGDKASIYRFWILSLIIKLQSNENN